MSLYEQYQKSKKQQPAATKQVETPTPTAPAPTRKATPLYEQYKSSKTKQPEAQTQDFNVELDDVAQKELKEATKQSFFSRYWSFNKSVTAAIDRGVSMLVEPTVNTIRDLRTGGFYTGAEMKEAAKEVIKTPVYAAKGFHSFFTQSAPKAVTTALSAGLKNVEVNDFIPLWGAVIKEDPKFIKNLRNKGAAFFDDVTKNLDGQLQERQKALGITADTSMFNPNSFGFSVGSGAGSLALAGGLSLVTKGTMAGAAALGWIEGSDTYNEARNNISKNNPELSEDEVAARALGLAMLDSAGIALLEKVGLDFLFRSYAGGFLTNRAINAITETAQEETQTVWSAVVGKYGYDKEQDVVKDMVQVAITTPFLGMLGGSALQNQSQQQAMVDTVTRIKSSEAFDIEASIEQDPALADKIYQNKDAKILTPEFAQGRIDDVAQKADMYKIGLGDQIRAEIDVNNTTQQEIVDTALRIVESAPKEIIQISADSQLVEEVEKKMGLEKEDAQALVEATKPLLDDFIDTQVATGKAFNEVEMQQDALNEDINEALEQSDEATVIEALAERFDVSEEQAQQLVEQAQRSTLPGITDAQIQKDLDAVDAEIRGVAEAAEEQEQTQEEEITPTAVSYEEGQQFEFPDGTYEITSIARFENDTKYEVTNRATKKSYWTNSEGIQLAIEAKSKGITTQDLLDQRNGVVRNVKKSDKKTQKQKVEEVLAVGEPRSIQDIAEATDILEPNVRRILGVGAKEGDFVRVDKGVYTIKKDGKDVAVVIPGDAVETLPKLAEQGFKADMVFLDIPYDTPAVKGGNRGVEYNLISVDDFVKVLNAVKKILRDENAVVLHMYSRAPSGMTQMQKYNDQFTELGFIPLAVGQYQKTFKDGAPVTSPNGKVAQPEGIIAFNQSGEFDKKLDLNFKMVRPKGYQTEKPAEMLKAMIEMTTEEGDVVLDPFAGSGVTGAEAVKSGRKAVLIEKKEDVARDITKKRVEEALDNKQEQADNEDNDKDTGRGTDEGGLPESVQGGGDKPRGTRGATSKSSESKRRKPDGVSQRGGEPGVGSAARLTNQEIEAIVLGVTDISTTARNEVVLTGEVTQDIRDAAAQYVPGGTTKSGRGILDEYYTNSKVVDIVKSLFNYNKESMKVLEPSVGTGNFLYALPDLQQHEVSGIELNAITARIAKILHPDARIYNGQIESLFVDERGTKLNFEAIADFDLVLGNPPYGEHRGMYLGLGEEAAIKKYEEYFMKRGIDLLKEGGYLAMVVPSGFLRGTAGAAKKAIAASAELVNAYRLPNGSFESTDIGTDIVVFQKKKPANAQAEAARVAQMSDDAFFENAPSNILGTQTTKKGKFGDEAYVEGTLDEALALFQTQGNTYEAIKILQEQNIQVTEDTVEQAIEAVEETQTPEAAKERVKTETKRETQGKKTIEKKIKKVSTTAGDIAPLTQQFDGVFTESELAAWRDTMADGTLNNHEDHIEIANYYAGAWYIDFNYAQGDIYEKLDQLEADRSKITDEQYNKQKALLVSVLPKPQPIYDINLSPNSEFVKSTNLSGEEGKTLKAQFLKWIRELPRESFLGSNAYEVEEYVNNEQVRGSDKDRNELVRIRRRFAAEQLFKKFVQDLSSEEQQQLEELYNRTYNFYHTPNYMKVPMFSETYTNFAGKPLQIRDVQKHGIGRLVNQGVGILAHDVGFGKTISGILALHETMSRGWAKKPLIVVPGDNVYAQWVDTITQLVPGAKFNLLGNLGGSFKGDLSSLKIEDGSISITTYEGFKRLGFKDETYEAMGNKFKYIADDLTKSKTEREKQKDKAAAMESAGRMKRGTRADLYFEDLGFDHITFDEVHNANHIVSKVKLEKGKASEFSRFGIRTSDLGMKTWLAAQYIQEKNNGRNVNLLSATPFTNNPLEYYSILSLVADKSLTRMGLNNVNEFFNTFMEAEHDYEFKADGSYQVKTDIKRFKNFRQFRRLLDTYIDFKEGNAPGIVRPNRIQKTYEIPQNELGIEMEQLAQKIFTENEKEEGKGARVLRAINELRKIAFSPYASQFAPTLDKNQYKLFVENSPKIKTLMGLIAQSKQDQPDAGQIVYVDAVGVDFVPFIKEYLVKDVGYAANEVEIITGATSKEKRAVIQEQFNNGDVKVLIGSEAIKEGINLQKNTTDLYVLSLPWNFTQLRQVIGRAWRQGNRWKNVRINNLFIQDSIDVFLSQKLENKQSRYEAAWESNDNEVDVGDVSFDELKFDLIKDPVRRAKLEIEAEKERLNRQLLQQEAEVAYATRRIDAITQRQKDVENTQDSLAREAKLKEDALAAGREFSDYWIDTYTARLQKEKAALAEMIAKVEEQGVNVQELIAIKEKGKTTTEELKAKIKDIEEQFEARVKEIAASLPPRAKFTPQVVDAFVLERATDNQSFYELAGQSKEQEVVIAEVEPTVDEQLVPEDKVFYHGTLEDFEEFSLEKAGSNTNWENAKFGIFFIADKVRAQEFAENTRQPGDDRPVKVKEAYLNIKNPLDLTLHGALTKTAQAATVYELITGEKVANDEAVELLDEVIDLGTVEEAYEAIYSSMENKQMLQERGFDGIVSEFGRDEDGNIILEYVAFEPSQVTVKNKTAPKKQAPAKPKRTVVSKKKKAAPAPVKAKKRTTAERETIKIITSTKITTEEKINILLDKKQEGKKFKDTGERVAGSKKERAVIRLVLENGNEDTVRALMNELGSDAILQQLDKKQLLENVTVPTVEGEIAKKTPAYIANYKVNVFNRVGRVPTITYSRGRRYYDVRNVDERYMETFVQQYPEAFRAFIADLTNISTFDELESFKNKYSTTLMSMGESSDSRVSINVLGKGFSDVVSGGASSDGTFTTKANYYNFSRYRKSIEAKKVIAAGGIAEYFDDYYEKTRYQTILPSFNSDKTKVVDWYVDQKDQQEDAVRRFLEYMDGVTLNREEVFAQITEMADANIEEFTNDYEKYLKVKKTGKTKQLEDAEARVKSLTETIARFKEEMEKDPTSTWFSPERLVKYEADLVEAQAFLNRITGQEEAFEHGNFGEIKVYDVKDTRFKKSFVTTENLLKVYGFKSAQLGNYMDDQSSKEHVLQTMAAMEDMSTILGVDFAKINKKMGLSIAFGARGGGRFLAHFEPTARIINLTKKRGDGSFGHEYMHALDYLMGENFVGGRWSSDRSRYRSQFERKAIHITRALKSGVEVMKEQTFTPRENAEELGTSRQKVVFEEVLGYRSEGKTFEEVLEFVPTVNSLYWSEYYQAIADVYRQEVTGKVRENSREYYKKSLQYGGGKDTSYWVRPQELWARAFQAYLEDKMEEAGVKNSYLTRSTKDIAVYPQGEERKAYNRMFDSLFADLKQEYPLPESLSEVRFKTRDFTGVKVDKTGYENVSNNLMGFASDGSLQKGFDEQNYSYSLPVRVLFSDGTQTYDQIRGLNAKHAAERAKRNWPGATIFLVPSDQENTPVLSEAGEYLDDLKRRLNIDFDVYFVDAILLGKRINPLTKQVIGMQQADGAYADNAIVLASDMSRFTAEHETVHLTLAHMDKIKVFGRNGLSRDKIMQAQAEALNMKWTENTDRFIEENVARGFEQYMAAKEQSPQAEGILARFFALLKKLVTQFAELVGITKADVVRNYYDVLSEAEANADEMVRLNERGIIESFISNGELNADALNALLKRGEVEPMAAEKAKTIADALVAAEGNDDAQIAILEAMTQEEIDSFWSSKESNRAWLAIERFAERAYGFLYDRYVNTDLKFKIRKDGDKVENDLKSRFNELVSLQEKYEQDAASWKSDLEIKILKKINVAEEIAKTGEQIKELSRFTKRKAIGQLTPRGEQEVENLAFENPAEVKEEIGEYLQRKVELVTVRNELRDLRKRLSTLRKDDKAARAELRDVERRLRLRKQTLERKAFYVDMGRSRGRTEQMKVIKNRGKVIRGIQDVFTIGDTKAKQLIGGRRIHLMSEREFDNFIIEFVNKAQQIAGTVTAQQEIEALIEAQQFGKVDNLRKAMGLPPVSKMKEAEAKRFLRVLQKYSFGDVFLTTRQIETVHRTAWGEVATEREVFELLKQNVGVDRLELKTLTSPESKGRYTSWIRLSRQHPFFAWLLGKRVEATIKAEREIYSIEQEINTLARKARASRRKKMGIKSKIVELTVPTDDVVFGYLEAEDKEAYKATTQMTEQELEFGEYLIKLYFDAYVYMNSEYGMRGRKNYMTHVRRSFFETLKESGVKEAFSEILTAQREEEAAFKILDDATGEVLAFEKFFGYAMKRTGGLVPTKNVARASLAYFTALAKKKALDEFIPEVMVAVQAHKAVIGKTDKGLLKDPTLEQFVKMFLNDAKGRKIDFVTEQGSKKDIALRAMMTWITIKYLGLNAASAIANFVGDTVVVLWELSLKETAIGLIRSVNLPKAHQINEQFRYFTGRNPIVELFDQQYNTPQKLLRSVMVLMSLAPFQTNKFFLRAKLTNEEWESGVLNDARLREIALSLSRAKPNKFYVKSLAGNTTMGGATFQFGTWAISIFNTVASDAAEVVKMLKNKQGWSTLTTKEAQKLAKFVIMAGLAAFAATLIGGADDDDESYLGRLIARAKRELTTLSQALQFVTDPGNYLLIVKELSAWAQFAQMVASGERYQRDGVGYTEGDLKWVQAAYRNFVPNAIKQFFPQEEEDLLDKLLIEAINSGDLDPSYIAETVYAEQLAKKELEGDSKAFLEYAAQKEAEVVVAYNLKKEYGNNQVAAIVDSEVTNDQKIQQLLALGGEIGLEQVFEDVKQLRADKNLCTNPSSKTGCVVSAAFYDAFAKQYRENRNATPEELKAFAPPVKIETPNDERDLIHSVVTYAKAIGSDPLTAFNRIFTGQVIRRVDNGAIIVERAPLETTAQIREERGATEEMRLDHTVPLQLGGSNAEDNLKLISVAEWEEYTPVENHLGKLLRNGTITKKQAQDYIIGFKNGEFSKQEILNL